MSQIQDIKPAVAIMIFDNRGRVLLQKRADVGLWGILSGHVEIGETLAEAAIREAKEETNLDITIIKLIGVYSDPESQVFSYPNGPVIHFITTYFLAQVDHLDNLQHSSESIEFKFFDKTALPEALLPMHPNWLEDALSNQETAFIR